MFVFSRNVHTGGNTDFKRLIPSTRKLKKEQAADYGNFNFGLIGSAMGLSKDELLKSAALAVLKEPGHRFATNPRGPTRGDQSRDQYCIRQGIWYWYSHYHGKPP